MPSKQIEARSPKQTDVGSPKHIETGSPKHETPLSGGGDTVKRPEAVVGTEKPKKKRWWNRKRDTSKKIAKDEKEIQRETKKKAKEEQFIENERKMQKIFGK
jgi:hypothetical protein